MFNGITQTCFALCLGIYILLGTSILSARAAESDIIFYGSFQSNNCLIADELYGYDSTREIEKDDCKDSDYSCDYNDKAPSVKIFDTVPVGTEIRVYDDHDCTDNDDAALIEVLESGRGDTCVESFEGNYVIYPDSSSRGIKVKVTQFGDKRNGLDGKVSCISISPASAP